VACSVRRASRQRARERARQGNAMALDIVDNSVGEEAALDLNGRVDR
jgi:hypothetical protein